MSQQRMMKSYEKSCGQRKSCCKLLLRTISGGWKLRVKWTHNPKLHRLKRFGQIDTLMSFYWHACHLLMHDDHDLDGHLY